MWFLDITIYQLIGVDVPTKLSDDAMKIIKACRKNNDSIKYMEKSF